MNVWGWWAFDIFTLMASYLGAEVTGAQTIMRSLGLISFMMPVGFATGCFVFVGASVGAK
jgi:Na+-driven multidrug efflux pump